MFICEQTLVGSRELEKHDVIFCSLLKFTDRAIPVEKHVGVMAETYGISAAPITPQMFGNAGREHMAKYGKFIVSSSTIDVTWRVVHGEKNTVFDVSHAVCFN